MNNTKTLERTECVRKHAVCARADLVATKLCIFPSSSFLLLLFSFSMHILFSQKGFTYDFESLHAFLRFFRVGESFFEGVDFSDFLGAGGFFWGRCFFLSRGIFWGRWSFWGRGMIFVWGGVPYPIFLVCPNLLVRVTLGYTLNFVALGLVKLH